MPMLSKHVYVPRNPDVGMTIADFSAVARWAYERGLPQDAPCRVNITMSGKVRNIEFQTEEREDI